MHKVGNQGAHKSKAHGPTKINSSVKIKPFFRIIPPAGVKKHLQNPAGKILHPRHNHHASKKQRKPGVTPGLQQIHNQQSSNSVHRTQRPPQKSPIAKMPMPNGTKACFPQPTNKAVSKKHHENVGNVDGSHTSSIGLEWGRKPIFVVTVEKVLELGAIFGEGYYL